MEWEYLGRFWRESVNTTWGKGIWAGRWGYNFEVGNVFRIGADGIDPNGTLFSLVGTEGGKYGIQGGRAQLWAAGDLEQPTNETVSFNVTMAGILEWGSAAYAASGKVVPANSKPSQASGAPDRYIVWLWLTGTFYDSIPFPVKPQGWDSSLLTPRELYVETIQNVVDNAAVHETGSWKVSKTDSASGTVELVTLGIKPAREAIAAYTGQSSTVYKEADRTLNGTASNATVVPFTEAAPRSRYYVLKASLTFPQVARNASDFRAGFQILSSEFEKTTIYYRKHLFTLGKGVSSSVIAEFSNESLIVDRSNSSAVALTTRGIDSRNEAGRLRLWDIKDTNGGVKVESLDLQIIVDNSIVEIYANNRFTLSTLVLPWYNSSKGISFFGEGEGVVSFRNVTVYEGLVDAWPDRVHQL
ncbi:extracellular invertase [Moniliophthora roreri]|nr:extracellular invertase [Moniliophthora roreri]